MSSFADLNVACPKCGRRSGDHTLDEWAVCVDTPGHDLPYEEIPADAAKFMQERLQLGDYRPADNVVAKSGVLAVATGPVDAHVPVVLLDFALNAPGGQVTTAQVAFIAPSQAMRAFGKLIRDCALGATDRAEQENARSRRKLR